jgi:hypothetical protein
MRDTFGTYALDAVMGAPDVEVAYLSRAFRLLPALSSLRFRAVGTSKALPPASNEMPSYYIRQLGRSGPVIRKDVCWVVRAARTNSPTVAWLAVFGAGICLKEVQADGLVRSSIFPEDRRFDSIRLAFRSLQHLKLSFSAPELRNGHTKVDGLYYLLSELLALESLDLCGLGPAENPRYEPCFNEYLNLGKILEWTFHYPRLARLSLQGFYAMENEITFLMETNAASLESLWLANIILIKIFEDKDLFGVSEAVPCWVEVIYGLQANLKLKHMEFDAYLSNRENQNWCINNDDGLNSLIARVESFVVNGGECPLDHCAVD